MSDSVAEKLRRDKFLLREAEIEKQHVSVSASLHTEGC